MGGGSQYAGPTKEEQAASAAHRASIWDNAGARNNSNIFGSSPNNLGNMFSLNSQPSNIPGGSSVDPALPQNNPKGDQSKGGNSVVNFKNPVSFK